MKKIKPRIIKDTFLYCRISNNMDGTEDELFNNDDKEDMNNDIKVENSDISSMGSSDEEIRKEKEN